jgi:hypothetical protein
MLKNDNDVDDFCHVIDKDDFDEDSYIDDEHVVNDYNVNL